MSRHGWLVCKSISNWRVDSSLCYNETRLGELLDGLDNSDIEAVMEIPWCLCWVPQDGTAAGVLRLVEAALTLMLMGVRMLVGVNPVLPSIRESKLRQVVGVSILTPSILLNGIDFSESETGLCTLTGVTDILDIEVRGKFSMQSDESILQV